MVGRLYRRFLYFYIFILGFLSERDQRLTKLIWESIGASGSASDRRHAFSTLAANYPSDPVDVIIGDVCSYFLSSVIFSPSRSFPKSESGDFESYGTFN